MEPLKSVQTCDYITDMLRDEIFSGALEDGEELAQEQLAQRLGVSRMPVREALQQLALEGILERLPNRHMRVAGITPRLVEQHFSMLAAVETEIVSILFREGLSTKPIVAAVGQYRAAVPQQGPETCAGRELFIHESLGRGLCNPFLYSMHQRLLHGYFSYALRHMERDWRTTLQRMDDLSGALERKELSAAAICLGNYFEDAAHAALTMIGGHHRVEPETH